ncbi:MAG TPA: aldolase/citrate lyase family protein [Rugosimonospora sp.]|nr:aldolase/citrate lyase family protein [Rugosimonospora sp.]
MLGEHVYDDLDRRLAPVDTALRRQYPGDRPGRQPVHTVYVPADAVRADLVPQWSEAACAALDAHPPLPFPAELRDRVLAKLRREPIEDLRIDFEDGYGVRDDAEEDAAARAAAAALSAPGQPPFVGIRCKCLEAPARRRAVRTLDVFLDALGSLPDGFVVTLPKVSAAGQVAAMVVLCGQLERGYGLPEGSLRFEVQVETPAAVLGADGVATVARLIQAADGRLTGLHYGTYDYSAACGIAAGYQSLEHPVADHAKAVMQVAAAGTGVRLSDGSCNILPVGDTAAVHAAWRLHARLVRRSLERGFYQGWDLHPAQLPTRYAATYAFFREGAPAAVARLRDYHDRRAGAVLDEPATARALTDFLRRGLDCGALDPAEVP